MIGDRMRVTALATPGHTFTHLSYALDDAAMGATTGVFSGGSLLYGATGVFPAHGFGSFCSATQSDATESTIGCEKVANRVLTQDEETWVRELLAGLDDWPAYYAHMGPGNAAGRHAPGTLNFGIAGPFATYLGWLIPWGTPVTLLGESVEDITEAQRELVRIGIDRPATHATGKPRDWSDGTLASFPTATFTDTRRLSQAFTGLVLAVAVATASQALPALV